jgi:hypothetical protein
MIDLLIALVIGVVIGYCLKKEQKPPVVDILANQVEQLEEKVAYYKDLCKWHVETKNESFESGRQQAEIEALNRELLRYKSNGEMGYANEQ